MEATAPAGEGWQGPFPGASAGAGSAATQAHLYGQERTGPPGVCRADSDPRDFGEAIAYFFSTVRARQTKGREPWSSGFFLFTWTRRG